MGNITTDNGCFKCKTVQCICEKDEGSESGLNDLLCNIGPLVSALAKWERNNGTLASLSLPERQSQVCKIISEWALFGAMRRADDTIKEMLT